MANIKYWYPFLKKWEGGLSNHPSDKGGLTNMGVTLGTWKILAPKLFGIQFPTETLWQSSLRNMTLAQWEAVVKTYWDSVRGDAIKSQAVAEFLADFAWGSGVGTAVRIAQRVLNHKFNTNVTVDGVIGQQTLNALNAQNADALFRELYIARLTFLHQIAQNDPTQRVFITGWENRLRDHWRKFYQSEPPTLAANNSKVPDGTKKK